MNFAVQILLDAQSIEFNLKNSEIDNESYKPNHDADS